MAEPRTEMETLVVFYSRTGNTRKIGQEIADALGADVEDLQDRANREGMIGFIKSCYHALRKRTTELGAARKDPAEYALVLIGTPVWAGNTTPAVRTWLAEHADRLPAVAFFTTSGGGGNAKTLKALAKLAGKEPVATVLITESEMKRDACAEKLHAFLEALNA